MINYLSGLVFQSYACIRSKNGWNMSKVNQDWITEWYWVWITVTYVWVSEIGIWHFVGLFVCLSLQANAERRWVEIPKQRPHSSSAVISESSSSLVPKCHQDRSQQQDINSKGLNSIIFIKVPNHMMGPAKGSLNFHSCTCQLATEHSSV